MGWQVCSEELQSFASYINSSLSLSPLSLSLSLSLSYFHDEDCNNPIIPYLPSNCWNFSNSQLMWLFPQVQQGCCDIHSSSQIALSFPKRTKIFNPCMANWTFLHYTTKCMIYFCQRKSVHSIKLIKIFM